MNRGMPFCSYLESNLIYTYIDPTENMFGIKVVTRNGTNVYKHEEPSSEIT
jgi:hypothetical protein